MPTDNTVPTETPVSSVIETAVTDTKKETTSAIKSISNFFSGLVNKAVSVETKIRTWFGSLKQASGILIGAAGLGLAGFLELTGALRILVIVPSIVSFMGSIGKIAIDFSVLLVSGTVSILQILLPLILVGISVYLIVSSINKTKK